MTGTIIRLPPNKFYGFISVQGTDYFFHRTDFLGHWEDLIADFREDKQKIEVEFIVADSNKGPRACKVRRLDFPNSYMAFSKDQ